MIVAVEATHLLREVRGIGRYVRALLPRLLAQRGDLELHVFAGSPGDAAALAELVSRDPLLAGRVRTRVISELTRATADVFWYPWNFARPAPARGPVVATIHDVAALAHPDPRWWRAWPRNLRLRRRFHATASRATLILCDSAFTASEVHRLLAVPHDRLRVALLAGDDRLASQPSGDAAALERLGIHAPFVLAVGATERRKNHGVLIRAMARVVAVHPSATLVMAGPHGPIASARDAPWLRTLGYVSEDDLSVLYRNTAALVMSSTYEGFGLPVVEAMQLGAPVICARASSLPEVAGDAGAWFAPDDDAALAAAMSRIMSDASVYREMSAASVTQAARFSWDATARLTLAAFDDAIRLDATQALHHA